MKEILSLYVGQAGVQIGCAMWELFCAEHGVSYDGKLLDESSEMESVETLFQYVTSKVVVPRSLFVDLEPTVIDEVRSGTFRTLFNPDRLISGPEDAANNFSRGFFTVGKLIIGSVGNQCRRLFEQSDTVQGTLIFRSLGGGTGSGLTSAMFECLSDYSKIPKIEIPIYPSPTLSTSMVEPYNSLLGEHFCMQDIDLGLLLDNEAMFDLCSKSLSINYPTYSTINRMIAQVISSITISGRFLNILNCDLSVLQTNLVPYPRIHFPLCNFAPLMSQERANHQELTVQDLTRLVFNRENQMTKVDHFYGKFMSCVLFYRGKISPNHVYMSLSKIKNDNSIEFVDWCPTGFKIGINAFPPVIIPESKFANIKQNVTMLTSTSAIGQAFQRLTHRFYLLYSKKSFVHWFIGEGMEECEFTEALYNISALVKDYVEAGQNTSSHSQDKISTPEAMSPVNVKSTESNKVNEVNEVYQMKESRNQFSSSRQSKETNDSNIVFISKLCNHGDSEPINSDVQNLKMNTFLIPNDIMSDDKEISNFRLIKSNNENISLTTPRFQEITDLINPKSLTKYAKHKSVNASFSLSNEPYKLQTPKILIEGLSENGGKTMNISKMKFTNYVTQSTSDSSSGLFSDRK